MGSDRGGCVRGALLDDPRFTKEIVKRVVRSSAAYEHSLGRSGHRNGYKPRTPCAHQDGHAEAALVPRGPRRNFLYTAFCPLPAQNEKPWSDMSLDMSEL